MMKMDNISVYKLVADFNRSDFRRKAIPHNLFSGWPCIHTVGKTLCLTIPYYARSATGERVALYPIYCSVTFPVANPDRLMDFTVYAHQRLWSDIRYDEPVGYFSDGCRHGVQQSERHSAHDARRARPVERGGARHK